MDNSKKRSRVLGTVVGLGIGLFAAILVILLAGDTWAMRKTVYVAAAVGLGLATLANFLIRRYFEARPPS